MDIVGLYGHNGQQLGDPQVAELLQRSVEGQWRMYRSTDEFTRLYEGVTTPRASMDYPVMTVLFAHELALLRWQMATNYIDGVVGMYSNQPVLPNDVYQFADSLCDDARALSKQAIELGTKLKGNSKVNLIQADLLTNLSVTGRHYEGLWGMFSAIASAVAVNPVVSGSVAVPERYKALFDKDVHTLRSRLEAFRYQEHELRVALMPANRLELVEEVAVHAAEMYKLLQRLQAPYLYGPKYAVIQAKKPTLSELSVSDPWVLTDLRMRKLKENDALSAGQLAEFWMNIQDTSQAVQVAKDIDELRARGVIRRRAAHGYRVVPWPSQFLVHKTFTYAGDSFAPGELVTLYADRRGEKTLITLRRVGKLTHILDLLGAR